MTPGAGIADGLRRLRDCLVVADFAGAEAIRAELETILTDGPQLSRSAVAAIRQEAAATADCVTAARQGLRVARRRIAELAGAERPSVYDESGRMRGLTGGHGGHRL